MPFLQDFIWDEIDPKIASMPSVLHFFVEADNNIRYTCYPRLLCRKDRIQRIHLILLMHFIILMVFILSVGLLNSVQLFPKDGKVF